MNKGLKIALGTVTSLGLWALLCKKSSNKKQSLSTCEKEERSTEPHCGCENIKEEKVKKVIGEQDESSLRSKTTNRTKNTHKKSITLKEYYQSDLERWGTTKGVIDVSNDKIAKKKKRQVGTTLLTEEPYKKDLKRWGTAKGVVDVSNDEIARKKKKEAHRLMGEIGKTLLEKSSNILQLKTNPKKDYQEWLQKEFETAQITMTNTSTEPQTVKLWGANKGAPIGGLSPAPEVEEHSILTTLTIPVAVYPQGIAVNPVNGLVYIANQLSNNVSVVSSDGNLITVIQLHPVLSGQNSPVDVAINTNISSANYGDVYVAGSVANTISVIDHSNEVVETIEVGNRPVSVAYNPINDAVYVVNIADNSMSIIDASYNVTATIPTEASPRSVSVNTTSGEVYVANTQGDSISVFDQFNSLITIIGGIVQPVSLAYHPIKQEMYVVSQTTNQVYAIDANYILSPSINVGDKPYSIVYNPHNELLYVGNQGDNTYSIITSDQTVRTTLSLGEVNIGLAVHPLENTVFSSDTLRNSITVIGFVTEENPIQVNEEYHAQSIEFQSSPALLKHAKFILSGEEKFNLLHLKEEKATGSIQETTISFRTYDSPRNFGNVAEVNEVDGTIIDGMHSWEFIISPLQTITVLIYFKQLEMYHLIH